LSRIEEALKRSAEGVAVAMPESADQRQFVAAWSEAEPRTAVYDRPTAVVERPVVVEARESVLVDEPGARLPRLNPAWRERLVSTPSCQPDLVAQFMRLAATLLKVQAANGTRVLMVTSPDPSDGKTLTAVNLALVLSDSYKRRVLLIDADLRRPSLGEMTGVVRSTGLSQALKAKIEQKLSVIPLTPTLALLPGGQADPDPIAGLTSERMKRILQDASARFDWVVLDAPPVGPLADAHLLAEMVDATLLVIRAAQTQCSQAMKAIEAIGRDRLLGVVLNAVEHTPADRYGAHYDRAEPAEKAESA
jgi:capsular exopolysaccharide synthesis family protein